MAGVQFGNQIDMNGLPITELAPGVAGTDAATVSQLAAAAPQGFAQDVGDGVTSAFTVTHGFNTLDVMVEVFEKATGHSVLVDVQRSSANAVVVTFGTVIASASHRVLVVPVP
jgi:hypothetical protein